RDCLKSVLEMEGYGVEEAGNGKEALEMLQTSSPDLILLDLNMPVVSGLEFLKRYEAGKVPVLVMTAMPGPAPKGATDFLAKPLDIELLLTKVNALCSSEGSR